MSLKASVYSDTASNVLQWQEVHSVTTNDVGIFTIVLGDGLGLSTSVQTNFSDIDWNASTHYIKIELDHGSGFMDYGTTALQSVPYALAAETADEANAVDWTNINNIPADIADGDDVDDADNSVTNELQTITLSGDTLYISGGNNVDLSGYNAGIFANDSNVTSNANGVYATDDFVFGAPTIDYDAATSDGVRMFFDKSTGSFRAGKSDNTNWDTDSLGYYSFATGYKTKATGTFSVAMGSSADASGFISTAMGNFTDASGTLSTAMGNSTEASGQGSTAMGHQTEASGDVSTAMGDNTEASAYASTAIGKYNIGGGNPTTWVATDPLFEIGNGSSNSARGNALTIYKDGSVEIDNTKSSGVTHGIKNDLSDVTSTSAKYGIYNEMPDVNGQKYGTFNYFPNGTSTGSIYGTYNGIYADGPDNKYGNYTHIGGGGGSLYGSYNMLYPNSSTNTSNCYGVYGNVSNSGTGTHYGGYFVANGSGNYGVYAANSTSGGYAGYFSGNVASSADFYAGVNNGVINCGGGVMSATINYIGDSYSAPSNVNGDEDLYVGGEFQVGNAAYKPGGGSWTATSDARLKTDIISFTDGLSQVLQINPVRFRYNEKSGFRDLEKQYIGVLAQDVLNVAPYMVQEENFWQKVEEDENGVEKIIDEGEKFYTFDPSAFDYMLINAVKEQQEMIVKLQEENQEFKNRITLLENK